MNREEARRYMIQWQQELKDGGFPIDSDRIQSLRVAIEALKDRPKGEWIDCQEYGYVECPFCGHATNCEDNKDELHFCFYCGAEMGGDTE